MGKFRNLTGLRFGKLTAIKTIGKDKYGLYLWECICDCGNTTTPQGRSLVNGNTASCGCVKRSVLPQSTTTHGMTKTRIYRIFYAMHNRCSDPKNRDYLSYGGRGITVCERWRKPGGFPNFLADMNEPPAGMTLERIDVNGNYEPGNCKWASLEDQAKNRRNSRKITWKGETLNLSTWAKRANRNSSWLHRRLKWMPLDKAMEPFN